MRDAPWLQVNGMQSGHGGNHDVRKQTWRSVLAGGAGVTYGHHAVWQFASARNGVINHADRDWVGALNRDGGQQMMHLRSLLLSRPVFTRVPDTTLVTSPNTDNARHIVASRDRDDSYAFVYFATNDLQATLNLSRWRGKQLVAWWYDPRNCYAQRIDRFDGGTSRNFQSPSYGPDCVLVLDDASAKYGIPGLARSARQARGAAGGV